MFCPNCGTKIENGAKFCVNCGAVVDSGNNIPRNNQKNSGSLVYKVTAILLICLSFALLLSGLIGYKQDMLIGTWSESDSGCINYMEFYSDGVGMSYHAYERGGKAYGEETFSYRIDGSKLNIYVPGLYSDILSYEAKWNEMLLDGCLWKKDKAPIPRCAVKLVFSLIFVLISITLYKLKIKRR